jgi:hypothetical protein
VSQADGDPGGGGASRWRPLFFKYSINIITYITHSLINTHPIVMNMLNRLDIEPLCGGRRSRPVRRAPPVGGLRARAGEARRGRGVVHGARSRLEAGRCGRRGRRLGRMPVPVDRPQIQPPLISLLLLLR